MNTHLGLHRVSANTVTRHPPAQFPKKCCNPACIPEIGADEIVFPSIHNKMVD